MSQADETGSDQDIDQDSEAEECDDWENEDWGDGVIDTEPGPSRVLATKHADNYSDDDERDVEDVNFNDLMLDEKAREVVKSKRGVKHNKEYSDRLTGGFKLLMGEANLCVAKGDRKTAINICLEIIRNIPDSPAPYETLSVIFEEENDLYKSLQYGLVSAHLWPNDAHKWYGLAAKCTELKDTENEKICMSKALRYSHLTKDRGFIEDVLSYFVKPGDLDDDMSEELAMKVALGYKKLIVISSDSECDELCKIIENFEQKCKDSSKREELWCKTYWHLIKRFPHVVTVEKLEKICQLLLSVKNYGRLIRMLVDGGVISAETYIVADIPLEGSSPDEDSSRLMADTETSVPGDIVAFPTTAAVEPMQQDGGGGVDLRTGDGMPSLKDAQDPAVTQKIQKQIEAKVTAMSGQIPEEKIAAATPTFDTRYCVINTDVCTTRVRAAVIAALIYIDHDPLNIEKLLEPLLKDSAPKDVAKELLIIADAYFDTNNTTSAQAIYDLISQTPTHSEHAHTLINLGLCLEHSGHWISAVKCYEKVLGFDPENAAAKLRLFTLQQSFISEHEHEFTVNLHAGLESVKDLSSRADVVKLSFHQCYEFISYGDYQSVMKEGYLVLKTALLESIELIPSSHTNSKMSIRGQHTLINAYNTLVHVTKMSNDGERQKVGACELYRAMLTREEWYDWYTAVASCCIAADRHKDGFILCLATLSSRLIDYQPAFKSALLHGIYFAGVLNYSEFISEQIGQLLYLNADCPGIWNIFYSIRHRLPQYRLSRLGIRALHKNRGSFNGLFLNMQNSFCARHYKAAIAFFRQMLGQRPGDAKIYFYLSHFYLHYAANKSVDFKPRRHEMALQAIASMLMYHQLRGSCQESLYNIGRCYHHLGLFNFALQYYKRALATAPTVPSEVSKQVNKMNRSTAKRDQKLEEMGEGAGSGQAIVLQDIDLKFEIVHNISLIYELCGADHLARKLMYLHSAIT